MRQEAGFGCCKCGFPIIQYHHIVPYREEPHYRAQDMMVLCPTHHDQATQHALTELQQRELKARPFNVVQNKVQGALATTQDYCAVRLGTVEMVGPGYLFKVDGEPLFEIGLSPDRHLTVSATLYDHQDRLLATIVDNEWASGESLPWDLTSGWKRLTIRQRQHDITLEVDARRDPMQVKRRLHRHGHRIDLARQVTVDGTTVREVGFAHLALVGMEVAVSTAEAKVTLTPDPVIKGGFVSDPDPEERLRKAVAFYRDLRARAAG